MNKSQYESYWKSRKPSQGYYSQYGQNGWTEKPSPRNSFPINFRMLVAWVLVWSFFFALVMFGAIGYDNTITIVNFFFGK